MKHTTAPRGQFAPLTPQQHAAVAAYNAPLALLFLALFAIAGFLATRKMVNDLRASARRRRNAPVSRYELARHCKPSREKSREAVTHEIQ